MILVLAAILVGGSPEATVSLAPLRVIHRVSEASEHYRPVHSGEYVVISLGDNWSCVTHATNFSRHQGRLTLKIEESATVFFNHLDGQQRILNLVMVTRPGQYPSEAPPAQP